MRSSSFIKQTLYALKKDYGESIDIYKRKTTSNIETGRRITTRTKIHINRAIILPSINIIKASSKGVDYGGYIETADRIVVVDKKDLKHFVIEQDDYVITEQHERYEIKSITTYESDAYLLGLKETKGVELWEIFDKSAKSKLTFVQGVSYEL